MSPPLLQAVGLGKSFVSRRGLTGSRSVAAVEDVSFDIAAGQILGLVGESGSGKSTVARLLLRLTEPTAGQVLFDGNDLAMLDPGALRLARRSMQMVFQNPHTSLHPRMTVAQTLAEPWRIQGLASGRTRRDSVVEMMALIGLPKAFGYRYPHELSGGQKQRVCIARALMLRPRLVVMDEPTSALDVSVQAQILELLLRLQQEFGLAYLFISHNLAVVRAMCTDLMVMYRGRIVEAGPTDRVLAQPAHPYTARLVAATLEPVPGAKLPPGEAGVGDRPAAHAGCRYLARCGHAIPSVCDVIDPALRPAASGVRVACHAPLHSVDDDALLP